MATAKTATPAKKDESITEKIGHVISGATETVVETFNKIIHPGAKKTAEKHRSGPRKTASAKAISAEKEEKAVQKSAVKKNRALSATKAAPKKAVKK
jgi:hypothetical protein